MPKNSKRNTVIDTKKTGYRIAAAIGVAGYSQAQVAELLQVNPASVSQWSAGFCYPTLDTFVRLADLLEVTIDDLIVRCQDDNSGKH